MVVKWIIDFISCIKSHIISNKDLKYTVSVNISKQDFAWQRSKITDPFNHLS